MTARNVVLIGAALALLALTGCGAGDGKGDKGASAPDQGVAAALDTCAEGRGAFAANVCENAQLAALDANIRQALTAEAATVSDAGAQIMVQNQQRWLEAQRIACGIIDPEASPNADQQTCLEAQFRQRVQQAQTAVQQIGGYTFQRMEVVGAEPVTAEIASASGLGDEAPPAITRNIRFPRIDGPQTPEIQRFNQLVAQQPQYQLEDATEEQVDYSIAYAGPDLISVRFDLYESSLGAAHPNSTSKAVTVVMSTGQPLAVGDVFRANSGWQRFLTERAMRELTRQFAEYQFAPPEGDVRESATKPHLWLITENALVVLFPPYSFGGPYALGGAEVSIPWSELRQFLNPNAPAPIRAQA